MTLERVPWGSDVLSRISVWETPKPNEARDPTGVFKANIPSGIDTINNSRALPEVIGVNATNPALKSINSIFDDALRDYIDTLSYERRESFMRSFSGQNRLYAEFDARAGQSGGLFGQVKDIGGRGLGIVADGLKLLDVASKTTEQGIGFLATYIDSGFGNDLSVGERWDAGRLLYEGFLREDNGAFGKALELAAKDDNSFQEFINESEGGWVDMGMRMVLDPLWLVGGVPVVPGLIKVTKVKSLDKAADFLRTGVRIDRLPGIRTVLENRVADATVGNVLRLFGTPVEARLAKRTVQESQLARSLETKYADETELANALGQVSHNGFIRNLVHQQPDREADNVADAIFGRLKASIQQATSPEEFKAALKNMQSGKVLIPGATEQRILDQLSVLRKLDFDSFQSLTKPGDDWKIKFFGELTGGPGKVKQGNEGSLLAASREFFQVGPPGPLQRLLAGMKYNLGFFLLNTPGYVVLNAVNNTFTTTFDALDAFDTTGRDAVGVIASRFGLFRNKHDEWMRRTVGDNWKEVRDRIADSGEYMAKEFGWSKQGNQHLWDNAAFNFGVRTANFFDVSARRTAAEFSMLRAPHYLNTFGKVFPDITPDLIDVIPPTMSPTELAANRDKIAAGEFNDTISMRKYENELYTGIDDLNTRLATSETLNVHLGGQKADLEDKVLASSTPEEAREYINKARAEMNMYHQRASRITGLGPNSKGTTINSVHDLRVNDWANLNDEFVYWTTQQELIMEASGAYTPRLRGAELKRFTDNFNNYAEIRQETLGRFADQLKIEGRAKESIDALELMTKDFQASVKAHIDKVVNRLAKSDISQARVFNDAGKRFLQSLGEVEDAYRSALRGTYWPRHLPENEALEVIKEAAAARSRSVRGLFSQNVDEFRVGSFPPPPMLNDFPTMADRFGKYNEVWQRYTDNLAKNVDNIFSEGGRIRPSVETDNLLKFIDEQVTPYIPDYEFARETFARHSANFSMLDYSQQRGFERYLQTVFPYEFWPTRTAWHWAERFIAKPGAVNGLYNIVEAQEEWQEQVNERYVKQIEEQLRDTELDISVRADLERQLEERTVLASRMRNLTIPVPFLKDMLKAAGLENFNPEIAFDPYAAMFPVASWDKDYNDFSSEPGNFLGKAYKYLEQSTPIAPNPMIKSALSLSGVLPERDEAFDFMRRAGSPAATALGMGPAGQAIYRWASMGDNGPIAKLEETLDLNIRDFFFENGYGPQGLLRYLAGEITGTDWRDEKNFELYGTSRVLGALAAEDSRLLSLENERKRRLANGEKPDVVHKDINEKRKFVSMEYVKAYYDQDGALWDKARMMYGKEQGLKDITSWLFGMGGINIWQKGEVIQTGLDFLHDSVNRYGDKEARDAFFDRYPEYTPRRIQDTVLSNQEAAMDIAREQLYYWDSNLINKTYERRLTELNSNKKQIQDAITQIESQGLNLRVNREKRASLFNDLDKINSQLSTIYDQRTIEYDKLDAQYGRPTNSYSKNPWERALDYRADEWYAFNRIKDEDARNSARDSFLDSYKPANQTNAFLTWLDYGSRSIALREKANLDSRNKSNEERRKINEKLESDIEELTLEAGMFINRRDIEEHLGLKETVPTAQLTEYRRAQSLYQQYKSFEQLGLSKEDESRRKKEFWDSNPLLERYYGLESYHGHPDEGIQKSLAAWYSIWENAPEGEARQAYLRQHDKEIKQLRAILEPAGLINNDPNASRLAEIWDGYYALTTAESKRAYLNNNRQEIDRLNGVLNRKPSQSSIDVAREGQIWNHYYSLPKGNARQGYLLIVQDELNEIRRRLGKEPLENIGYVNDNPRLSDSAPVESTDLQKLLGVK